MLDIIFISGFPKRMQGGDACVFDILDRTNVYMCSNTTEDGAKGYFPFLFSTRGFLPIGCLSPNTSASIYNRVRARNLITCRVVDNPNQLQSIIILLIFTTSSILIISSLNGAKRA